MTNQENIKSEVQEILALFNVVTDDLRDYKKQQFIIVNYALLLIGVIFIFYDEISTKILNSCWIKTIFSILIIAIASLGTIYIINLQKALKTGREQLSKIYKKLSPDFKYCLGEIPDNYTSFSYYFGFYALSFIIILLFAAFWAVFYILI